MLNVNEIRQDFPILNQKVMDHPLVYLDNAASTHMSQQAIDVMVDYVSNHHSNVHRGAHTLSGRATNLYEESREKIKNFIHARHSSEVIFTSGTTMSLNLIARMLESKLEAGDEILITEMEHHSNLIPWQELARRTSTVLRYIPITEDEELDLEQAKKMIHSKTKILSIAHVSNVLGVVNPIQSLAELARQVGAYVVVDGAQAVGHMKVDVQELDVDFYAFSGHKMTGPTGIGVLYGKEDVLKDCPPIFYGGEMINKVTKEESSWKDAPYKFEAGTPNVSGAIALATACDYLNSIGMEAIEAYESSLMDYVMPRLYKMTGLELYGPKDVKKRTGVIAFNIAGVHPHDVATVFDAHGVAIRSGHHCAEPLMSALSCQSTARASFYFYNTKEEADQLIEVIQKTKDFFKHG